MGSIIAFDVSFQAPVFSGDDRGVLLASPAEPLHGGEPLQYDAEDADAASLRQDCQRVSLQCQDQVSHREDLGQHELVSW